MNIDVFAASAVVGPSDPLIAVVEAGETVLLHRRTRAPGPAPFSTEKAMERSGKGFKYELLYQGIAAGVVSLLYREYVDDLVRPAFQQDLSYTLAPQGPTEISFRGTRIVFDAADNKASATVS